MSTRRGAGNRARTPPQGASRSGGWAAKCLARAHRPRRVEGPRTAPRAPVGPGAVARRRTHPTGTTAPGTPAGCAARAGPDPEHPERRRPGRRTRSAFVPVRVEVVHVAACQHVATAPPVSRYGPRHPTSISADRRGPDVDSSGSSGSVRPLLRGGAAPARGAQLAIRPVPLAAALGTQPRGEPFSAPPSNLRL